MNTTTKYAVTLEVDPSFSAFTIGRMIADAMAEVQDEPFDTNFDPFWDGTPRMVLPLVYQAPGLNPSQVGTLTITAPNAVECYLCPEIFLTKEDMHAHLRSHVQVGGPVLDDAAERELNGPMTGDQDGGPWAAD